MAESNGSRETTLGECADWLSGGTPRKSRDDFWGGDIPWASAKDMKVFRLYDTEDHITQLAIDEGARVAPQGAILILVRGMTLHNDVPLCVTMREMAFNQDVRAIVPKKGTDLNYLAYWLLAKKPMLLGLVDSAGHGTGRFHTDVLKALEINLPPLPEQRAIASILGALDDKIELNRRMNATLESLARAIFKSWFVDFDPVKINAGQMPASSQPLAKHDPKVLDLFPSTFQDSELGPIPDGWSVHSFGDHVTVTRGLSYKGAGLADNGIPLHNLNSVHEGGGYKHSGIKFYNGEFRDRHEVVPGDLIVTNTEQGFEHLLIGYAALVPEQFGEHGIFSHHIYRLRKKKVSCLTPHYLLQLINSPRWHRWISGFSNGTTVNMLPMDALERPLLVIPPSELVARFTDLANNVAGQIEGSITANESLARMRDTLLPRLLSGDLPVDDLREEA